MTEELNDRERAVLELVADGMENSEIGCELHLSAHTIKTYVARILSKIGARNRAHAVALAYHNGLLVPRVRA